MSDLCGRHNTYHFTWSVGESGCAASYGGRATTSVLTNFSADIKARQSYAAGIQVLKLAGAVTAPES